MADIASSDALRSSYECFVDPFRSKDEPASPETNAWESFLVGKNGAMPSMKETPISYLDHFETASNEANLLLGGLRFVPQSKAIVCYGSSSVMYLCTIFFTSHSLHFSSPTRPSIPDRHVRGSGSSKNGNEKNSRSRSSSPPKVAFASTSISSTSKTFSSSSITYGNPDEETLEEKISRVMSGHYSIVKSSPASRQNSGLSPERGSPGREREREREREKEKKADHVSIMRYLN